MVVVTYLVTERVRDDRYRKLLDREELAAASRQADGHLFVCARGLVRESLSIAVPDVAPEAWTFARTATGKPFVTGPAPAPAFNLSHTDGLVACAVAPGDVGVDVEPLARGADILETVLRAFASSEVAAVRAAPDPARRAAELWTVKEAYLKGLGTGIARHLDRFAVVPVDDGVWHVEENEGWRVHTRIVAERWILATAAGAGESIAYRDALPA